MITHEVISEIYRKYNKKPKSVDCLNLAYLFDKCGLMHDIMIDPETETMTIGSIPNNSLFHEINLKNVCAIVPFEEWTAIVLHSSILFLNQRKPLSSVSLRPESNSLWGKIKQLATTSFVL